MNQHKKVLGFFQLVMINVIAVDSIRSLPFAAEYGLSLVFFYVLAAIGFFIPSALVSAELGTGWPTTGGIYVWVREAFGKKMGFVVIWLNWIYNIAWFPTIMALIAGTAAYFFNPEFSNNKIYMVSCILVIFWGATLLNCLGMKVSSAFSTVGALIGTIFPMLFIIALGLIWMFQGKPLQIDTSWNAIVPDFKNTGNLAFLTNVLFGLLGLEMSATHAAEIRNPQKDYPRALFVSVVIILGTIILSSLAIAVVVPKQSLSLVTGTMQAFAVFVNGFGIPWLIYLIAGFIILGGMSGAAAWIIGPTKGLMVASHDGSLPKILGKTNRHGVPVNILILQAIIVSLLSLAFIFMPTVNSSFWILSAITAQLALLVYIGLFAAGLKLHYHKPEVVRSFRVPGKKIGMWSVCGIGIVSCIIVILLGFLPPDQAGIKNLFLYELILIGGMIALCLVPLFIIKESGKIQT
ncbi:MAG TPA: APC family permease [Rhabdochlamydiaceae bacterium]|nr:APC family permease [Rhabdochlamydiaceae bacterium]